MEITKLSDIAFELSNKNIQIALNEVSKKANVVLFASENNDRTHTDDQVVFDSQGEYEVKNTMIDGVLLSDDNTSYCITLDGVRIGYIASLDESLTDAQTEAFAATDVLILPAAGDKAEVSMKVITQVEPKVVIPHSFTADQLSQLQAEFGGEGETVSKIKLNKKDLAESENASLVVLS